MVKLLNNGQVLKYYDGGTFFEWKHLCMQKEIRQEETETEKICKWYKYVPGEKIEDIASGAIHFDGEQVFDVDCTDPMMIDGQEYMPENGEVRIAKT